MLHGLLAGGGVKARPNTEFVLRKVPAGSTGQVEQRRIAAGHDGDDAFWRQVLGEAGPDPLDLFPVLPPPELRITTSPTRLGSWEGVAQRSVQALEAVEESFGKFRDGPGELDALVT